VLSGDVPSPAKLPHGCHFHSRCPIAQPMCRDKAPEMRHVGNEHAVACHFAKPNPIPL
jgi:oligopeptide/dipeptide ABC transporter ATP-binding protein